MVERDPGKRGKRQGPRPEEEIDEALDESFPASDPPAWTADVEPGGPEHVKGRSKPPPAGPEKKHEEAAEQSHTKGRPTPPPAGPSGPGGN